VINLHTAQLAETPFKHFAIKDCLAKSDGDKILQWFETAAVWKDRGIPDFYSMNVLELTDAELPHDIQWINHPDWLCKLRSDLERLFSRKLLGPIKIDAHIMTPGHKIGIHTDFGFTKQTHRLVIQLNRGWTVTNGGRLVLLPERSPKESTEKQKIYLPLHCSAVGFEISDRSYHAVTPILSGERYTLCYSVEE
jgi:Rps23 Pro-64 3,4-dihydroxylase Tpa1-like proline 4-hydroxylase